MPRIVQRAGFSGGYRFHGFAGQPIGRIERHEGVSRIHIPYSGGRQSLLVKAEDRLSVGQAVAGLEAESPSHGVVISPVAGSVAAVDDRWVVVDAEGDQDWVPVSGCTPEWGNLAPSAIEQLIVATGSTAVCPSGIPTHHGSSHRAPEDIRHIIVTHPNSDVFKTPLDVVMEDRDPGDLVSGIAILTKIMTNAAAHLALSGSESDTLRELRRRVAETEVVLDVQQTSDKYPQDHEAVLSESVAGVHLSPGERAIEVGILILDVSDVLQIFDAVTIGKPFIERVIALSGPGFAENLHLRVRIGTPVGALVETHANAEVTSRIVYNSVMTGRAIEDMDEPVGADCRHIIALPEAPVEFMPFAGPGLRKDSYTHTFLASLVPGPRVADTNLHGDERPCLSCTYCERVCPAGILPYVLHRYVQRDIIDENLVRYGAFRCIDCNLCTYVCPSKIPLARLISDGKQKLLDEGFEPVRRAAPAAGAEHAAGSEQARAGEEDGSA